jgi:hypothetical protein
MCVYVGNSIDVEGILGTNFMLDYTSGWNYRVYYIYGICVLLNVNNSICNNGTGNTDIPIPHSSLVNSLSSVPTAIVASISTNPKGNQGCVEKGAGSVVECEEREDSKEREGKISEGIVNHVPTVHEHDALYGKCKQLMLDALCEYFHVFGCGLFLCVCGY